MIAKKKKAVVRHKAKPKVVAKKKVVKKTAAKKTAVKRKSVKTGTFAKAIRNITERLQTATGYKRTALKKKAKRK